MGEENLQWLVAVANGETPSLNAGLSSWAGSSHWKFRSAAVKAAKAKAGELDDTGRTKAKPKRWVGQRDRGYA